MTLSTHDPGIVDAVMFLAVAIPKAVPWIILLVVVVLVVDDLRR